MLISTDRRWRESVIDVVCAPAGLDLKDPRGLLGQELPVILSELKLTLKVDSHSKVVRCRIPHGRFFE
jgi:hypothetical protein